MERKRTEPVFDKKTLGDAVYQQRHRCRWSRKRLAERAGVSPSTVQRLEDGQLPAVSLDTICRVSKAMDVPLPEFLASICGEINQIC